MVTQKHTILRYVYIAYLVVSHTSSDKYCSEKLLCVIICFSGTNSCLTNQKFHRFYRGQKSHYRVHRILSRASWIQSILSHLIYLISTTILPYHQHLSFPGVHFLSTFALKVSLISCFPTVLHIPSMQPAVLCHPNNVLQFYRIHSW
jgi:hypothetical protein